MKLRVLAALALLTLAPVWSAVAGTLTSPDGINKLKAGTTTAVQTVALLGKPNQENRSPDGRFAYMYEFDLPNQADPSQPRVQGVAALMFSDQGVLEDVRMFKKADTPGK